MNSTPHGRWIAVSSPDASCKSGWRHKPRTGQADDSELPAALLGMKSFQGPLSGDSSSLGDVHIILAKYICFHELICFENYVHRAGKDMLAITKVLELLRNVPLGEKDVNPDGLAPSTALSHCSI